MTAMPPARKVLTIGHSNHTIAAFLSLLTKHAVTAVVDIRSIPHSRLYPQFNRDTLRRTLQGHGISYVFLGKELGGRSGDESCYENGRIQYVRLAKTELFRSGLERVCSEAEKHCVALMCAEREPLECHRTLLVGRELAVAGTSVAHIHADGHLEPHAAAMTRLLALVGLPERDLFLSRAELIEMACAKQERRVAYVEEEAMRDAQEAAP